MKKIITKISLSPLLTLFTRKKTVRSHSDIVVQKPEQLTTQNNEEINVKLNWETEANEERISEQKPKRSVRKPGISFFQMTDRELLCYSQSVCHKITDHSDDTVSQISMVELISLVTDFELAHLLKTENSNPVNLHRMGKAREDLINCLAFLRRNYKI